MLSDQFIILGCLILLLCIFIHTFDTIFVFDKNKKHNYKKKTKNKIREKSSRVLLLSYFV